MSGLMRAMMRSRICWTGRRDEVSDAGSQGSNLVQAVRGVTWCRQLGSNLVQAVRGVTWCRQLGE